MLEDPKRELTPDEARQEVYRLLRDDDLANRFFGVLDEIVRRDPDADIGAILRTGAQLVRLLGPPGSTVEQIVAAYDALGETIQ